ncbi:MAG: hypothetical protein ACK5NN_02850 [Sphingomonadaceae bacterium]
MIAKPLHSWQTSFADLCLILFMLGLSFAQSAPDRPEQQDSANPPVIAQTALAIFRPDDGADLRQWLDTQSPDQRVQLTIQAYYQRGHEGETGKQALALARQLPPATTARIVLEEGTRDEVIAVLAYDRPEISRHAQKRQSGT